MRVLFKNPIFTLINLLGLVIAFTFSTLIYLHLHQELSYDGFHDQAEDIYRIAWMSENPQTRTPHPMAQAMKRDFSEVEAAVSLSPIYGPALTKTTTRFKNPENNVVFEEPEGYLVDTTFFDVFSFEFLEGHAESLQQVGGILITESMAQRFFGMESPMGKFLAYGADETPVAVMAVLKDPPLNSHFRFNYLVSYVTMKTFNPGNSWYKWGDFGHFNYLKLRPGAKAETLESKIPKWVTQYISGTDEELRALEAGAIGFDLQPIKSIHLHSHLRWELDQNSDVSYLSIYALSALFILLISVINFVNLTTARSVERLKEIGIKKTLGAFKKEIFGQFLFESFTLVLAAIVLSFFVAYWTIGEFNLLFNGHLTTSMLVEPSVLALVFGLGGLITLLSAFYPSIYLNSIDPGKILKGMSPGSLGNNGARDLLLGLQFFVSVLLICSSLLIYGQVSFLKHKGLGFNKENLMTVRIKSDEVVERLQTVKNRLAKNPNIGMVSAVSNIPGGQFNYNPVFWNENPNNRVNMAEFLVDFDVFSTLGLELKEGRFFDKNLATDSTGVNYLLNETAVKNLGLEQPIGKQITWDDDDRTAVGTVVGVVKDFHFKSLHEPIRPIIMQIYPEDYSYLLIKVSGNNLNSTVKYIEEVYSEFDPINVFQSSFLNRDIDNLYKEESRTLSISLIFSVASIFLAIAGLIGIARMILRKQVKEIGIRKVLGASLMQILWLLNLKYLKIAGIALLLAIPATYWLISDWLNNFTYQKAINPLVFVLTIVAVLVLIIVTISAISIKTSRSNPSKSLRYE